MVSSTNQIVCGWLEFLFFFQWEFVADVSALIGRIAALPEAKPLEDRIRLWSNPYWAGLLLGLLAIYWTGRKLAGMI